MENKLLKLQLNGVLAKFAGAAALAILVGCASTPPTGDAPPVGASDKTLDDGGMTPEQLALSNPVSDEALAAALADNFWDTDAVASVNDQGQLVYSAQGDIVADPNYNRTQLQSYRFNLNTQQVVYDPITGRPLFVDPRFVGGASGVRLGTPRAGTVQSPRGLEPAPRIRTPSRQPSRQPAPAPSRRSSGGQAGDSRR